MTPEQELALYQKEPSGGSAGKDSSLQLYQNQQNLTINRSLSKLIPYNYKDFEMPETGITSFFRYSNYLPHATGKEKEYAEKHPLKASAEFTISRLMLPDVVTKSESMYPSINKDYEGMPLPLAGGLLAAEAALFVPGALKLPFKLAAKGFTSVTKTGLKVGGKAFMEGLQLAGRTDIPLVSKTARKAYKALERPLFERLPDHFFESSIKEVARKEILFRKFGVAQLPHISTLSKRNKYVRVYEDMIKSSPFMKRYGLEVHPEVVFKAQMKRFFGQKGLGLGLENASSQVMKNVLFDLGEHAPQIAKNAIIGNMAYVRPVRKVLGFGESMGLRTYTKGYVEVGSHFTNFKQLEYRMIENFHILAQANGLGKIITRKRGPHIFMLDASKQELKHAGRVLHKLDELTRMAEVKNIPWKETRPLLQAHFDELSPKAQGLVKTYRVWADQMYHMHFWHQVGNVLRTSGMDPATAIRLEGQLAKIKTSMANLFDPKKDILEGYKHDVIKGQLGQVAQTVKRIPARALFPDIANNIPQALEARKRLVAKLQLQKENGPGWITNYLDNYAQRILARQEKAYVEFKTNLFGSKRAGHTHHRDLGDFVTEKFILDIQQMVEQRATAQSKEITLKKFLDPKGQFAKWASSLPNGYKEYVEHYLSRMLGRPSMTDMKMAESINKWLGGRASISGSFIDKVAQEICNLAHMGMLGLNPAKAGRNLFQHPILAGTELGSNRYMVKGMLNLKNPAIVKELHEMGVVQEFAPELYAQLRAFVRQKKIGFGDKKIVLPSRLSTMDEFRDATLLMYGKSDEFSRLSTGATAMAIWDDAAAKFGSMQSYGRVLSPQAKNDFFKAIKIKNRDPHIRQLISRRLSEHDYQEARKLFIKDSVAEVQFLYGKTDSPLYSHTLGAAGKTASVFQSWFINYSELVSKWARSGDVDEKMLTWLTANTGAYFIMSAMWGRHAAVANTFMAVQPNMPVVYTPVISTLEAILNGSKNGIDVMEKDMNKIPVEMFKMFFPAGGQLFSMAKAFGGGGVPKGIASIPGFHRGQVYRSIEN